MQHPSPAPTTAELEELAGLFGQPVSYAYRIEGGLSCTMDVLRLGSGAEKVVLRRFWTLGPGEIDPSLSETRALVLAAEQGIPAPTALWRDGIGLFDRPAVILSFLEGSVLLEPDDPLDWAAQLARVLVTVHRIRPGDEDAGLFPALGPGDDDHIEESGIEQHPLGRQILDRRDRALSELATVEPVYVHHDFWAGNTLWSDGRLVAVVDWEGGSIGDPAIDVAYCAFDMRMLGMDQAADHFIETYRRVSGRALDNLEYRNLLALCRPMPDVGIWVPAWIAMGVDIDVETARHQHDRLIREALDQA